MNPADIFKVEGHLLVLDQEYIRGIPEYKVILQRKITDKGDADGRKKLEHWKLFMYIKMMADKFVYCSPYSDKDKHEAACKESGLDLKYKPDDEVKAAIEKFKEIQIALLPVLELIDTVLASLRIANKTCKLLTSNMQKSIEAYEEKVAIAESTGETSNIADSMILVNGLIEQLDKVNKIAINIPKLQSNLEDLRDRLLKQSAGDTVARGGQSIGNRADPKK